MKGYNFKVALLYIASAILSIAAVNLLFGM